MSRDDDTRPATPAEAPRHECDHMRRVTLWHRHEPVGSQCIDCDMRFEKGAASSGASAARLSDACQEHGCISAQLVEDIGALTDALASALKYMRHEPWCRSKWCYKCTGLQNDANNYVHTQRDNAFYHVFAPRGCDCGLEDVLTILRRAEKEQK